MNIDFNFEKYPELKIFTKSFNVAEYKPFVTKNTFGKAEQQYINDFIPVFQEKISLENVFYISSNIFLKIFDGGNKFKSQQLMEIYADNTQSSNGIIITEHQTYFFYFEPETIEYQGKKAVTYKKAYTATFAKGHLFAFSQSSGELNEQGIPIVNGFTTIPTNDALDLMADINVMCLFLKYVEIETKVIQGRDKAKLSIGTVKNNTPFKLKYVTSNYFTNLERSGAFGVRGHWRFQPYGAGMSQVKMIWIKEYVKDGYNREADKTKWSK